MHLLRDGLSVQHVGELILFINARRPDRSQRQIRLQRKFIIRRIRIAVGILPAGEHISTGYIFFRSKKQIQENPCTVIIRITALSVQDAARRIQRKRVLIHDRIPAGIIDPVDIAFIRVLHICANQRHGTALASHIRRSPVTVLRQELLIIIIAAGKTDTTVSILQRTLRRDDIQLIDAIRRFIYRCKSNRLRNRYISKRIDFPGRLIFPAGQLIRTVFVLFLPGRIRQKYPVVILAGSHDRILPDQGSLSGV